MQVFFFKLKTKRIHFPGDRNIRRYGEARLYFPMAIAEDDAKFFERVSNSVRRKNDKDETWELRVLAFALEYLEEQGFLFHSLTNDTPYPNVKDERAWIIATVAPPSRESTS